VLFQICGRTHNDAPDIAAQTGGNKGGVWQMPDPYSDVDTLVYEVHEPIKEENCNRNVRIAVKKLVDDWSQHLLSIYRRSRDG
jgi:hypothetical protein